MSATPTTVVLIPTTRITDWVSFHAVFEETFGFPISYGRNMDAWIDCMTYLDDEDADMSKMTVKPGALLTLRIDDAPDFQRRCPEQYEAIVQCTAFVNYRRIEIGQPPLLTMMLNGHFKKS